MNRRQVKVFEWAFALGQAWSFARGAYLSWSLYQRAQTMPRDKQGELERQIATLEEQLRDAREKLHDILVAEEQLEDDYRSVGVSDEEAEQREHDDDHAFPNLPTFKAAGAHALYR